MLECFDHFSGLPPDGTEGKKKLQFIEVRDDIRAREVSKFPRNV